jgi:lipopolysaccharide/colanic/teichoic acid biosynthesis glycosyltransferase
VQIAIQDFSEVRQVPLLWWQIKRLIDVVLGAVFLLLSSPIIAVAAFTIIAVTGGAPFFVYEVVGMKGRRFKMVKLRTMVRGAHAMREQLSHLNEVTGPVFKIRNDPRLHPLGKILRCTSIDELPSLLNVVLGDMSLVGPKALMPEEIAQCDGRALRRLTVPQGITCLWQINGRSDCPFEKWMELDNRYIDEWTPLGDIVIILKTIPSVLRRSGAY